jgi:raffinose/stachyose/melibiose transport system permease protein
MVISSTGLGGLAQFIMISKAHLRNTFFIIPLVFGVSGAAFCILVFYGFFRALPYELEESGYIDGSSVARAFWSIILPNSMPVIASLVIVLFMNNFNEFYSSTIFIDSDYLKTITVGVVSFVQGRMVQYQLVAASLVISSIPTVVIYLSMSEQIEKALTVNAGLK